MKSAKMWLGLLAACGVAAMAASAKPVRRGTETAGGVAWSYTIIGETASVTGAEPAVGVLEIPSSLGGFPVTAVGYRAFSSCEDLTGVEIPMGVAEVESRAFQYCPALASVTIPDGVTNIGAMAFQYCGSLDTVVLPQTVEDIGTNTFYYCDALSKLYVPACWTGTSKVRNAGVGSGCTVVYGEPGKETLKFDANGGNCETAFQFYPLDEPYGWLPEATREDHFEFAGWWTAASGGTRVMETDVASAEGLRTLYAHWMPLEQVVSFNANGGSCETTSFTYAIGDTYSFLPMAMREGYAFDGWFTASSGGERILQDATVTEVATRTLYAHWTLVEQTVTFNANGGSCGTASRVYVIGDTYLPLPTALWQGYDFDGWFTDRSGGARITKDSRVTEAISRTFYAHWTLSEQVVTFDANGGVCDTASRTYTIGNAYGWLPEAEREGYSFDGWFDSSGSRIDKTSKVTVMRQRTLQARWSLLEQVVTFDANGGECDTVTHTYAGGAAYGWLPEAEREGYSFDGWYDFSGKRIDTTSHVAEERTTTLQAHWKVCQQIVSFDAKGGECDTPSRIYVVGEAYGWLPEAYLKGYRLEGWFDASGNQIDTASLVTAERERTLQALWRKQDERETVEGVTWSYYVYRNEAFITKATPVEGAVTIPDSLGGYPVTDFDPSVFARQENLTSVTIPDSVRAVGSWAFYDCPRLTEVTIGNGVGIIESYAFFDCTSLTNLAFGNGMADIGCSVFYGCPDELFDMTSRPGLCLLHDWVVGFTDSLSTDVDWTGIRGIAGGAFTECGLQTVTLPEGVVSIGERAFSDCYDLTSVSLPSSITRIGAAAFAGCANLKDVQIATNNPVYVKDGGLFFSRDGKTLVYCLPETPLGVYTIPDSVTAIEEWAFGGCVGLTSVTIGTNVTHLGEDAFAGCTNLTAVTILGNIANSYGEDGYPFTGCRNLQTVSLGGCLTEVPDYTFFCCHALESIEFGGNITRIGIDAFAECGLVTLRIPDGVTEIDHYAFSGCQELCTGGNSLTTVWLPASVTNIGYKAFNNCSGLATMYVPEAWRGTSMLSKANITSSCRISYYSSPATKQTVAFDATGGTCETASHAYAIGATYSPLPTATRENWAFDGWFTEAEGGEQVSDSTTVTETATRTFYAHWTLVEQVVAFDANGGECETGTRSYSIGETYSPLPTATRENWAFDGWFADAGGGGRVSDSDTVTEAENRTFYAHWTLVEQVVAFDANGGECETATRSYVIGETYSPLPVATRANWAFNGWFTEVEGDERVSEPTTVTEAQNRTFYAHWRPTGQTVAFDANGGTCTPSRYVYTIGEPYGWLPEAEKDGFSFAGWFDAAGNRVEVESEVTDERTRSLWAQWITHGEVVDGVAWTFVVRRNEAFITHATPLEGAVGIPETLEGHPVVGFSETVFFRQTALTSISIPTSITNIESGAFLGCTGLTEFKLAADHPAFAVEDGVLFSKDGKTLVCCPAGNSLGAYAVPESVTDIGKGAFSGCGGLTSVAIGTNVTSIGDLAFSDCVELGAVTILGNITNNYAENLNPFANCLNLQQVLLGGSMTCVPSYIFHACNMLCNVKIGEGVLVIGRGAFRGCNHLSEVVIDGDVTDIETYAFYDCNSLTAVTIPNSVTNIGEYAFYHCNSLTSMTIPDNVTDIKAYTFEGCRALMSMTIPSSVTNIGGSAFYGCSGLTSVTIPDSVRSIGRWAFCGCSGLTSVTLPDSVTSIAEYVFRGCSGLSSITIPNSVTSIGEQAFRDCRGLSSVTLPDSVTSIGEYVFSYCSGLKTVTIRGNVTNIGSHVFYYCDNLLWLYVPASWKGTNRLRNADVPSACTIIYVTPFMAQTVTFAVTVGSCGTGSRAYTVGLAYGWLPEATRPGFAFAGWWTAEEGGTQVTEASLVEDENPRTLYAHWTLASQDYAAWVEKQGNAAEDFPPDGDADGDGTTNWEEYVAGTNPLDAEERLEVRMEWVAGALKLEPSVALPSGRSIRVKGKRTLDDAEEWTDLTGEESTWMEDGWRFFRVGVELAE